MSLVWILLKGYSKAHLFENVGCSGLDLSVCGRAEDDGRKRLPILESTELCRLCLEEEKKLIAVEEP